MKKLKIVQLPKENEKNVAIFLYPCLYEIIYHLKLPCEYLVLLCIRKQIIYDVGHLIKLLQYGEIYLSII